MQLQDVKFVSELLDIVDRDIIKPIEEGGAGNLPNPANLDQWLKELKAKMPKTSSLFRNEPKATIGIP